MSLENHNKSQSCQVQGLIDRERWYLSERLGYDCTTTSTGLCMLNNRVATLITEGFGQWMAELESTEEI